MNRSGVVTADGVEYLVIFDIRKGPGGRSGWQGEIFNLGDIELAQIEFAKSTELSTNDGIKIQISVHRKSMAEGTLKFVSVG